MLGGLHYRLGWPEEYFRAADVLMKTADERRLLNRLAVPIMYLHRHALAVQVGRILIEQSALGVFR